MAADDAKPPKAWVAAVLTLLAPGLGHFYAGAVRRGVSSYVVWSLVVVALSLILASSPPVGAPLNVILPVAIAVACMAWFVVDAVRVTRDAAGRQDVPHRGWYVYALLALGSAFVVWPILTWPVKAYWIPSAAMAPTLEVGDHVYVNRLRPEPERGKVVVFVAPADHRTILVKRVVAGEGDRVEIRAKRLFVNGDAVSEPYARVGPEISPDGPRDNFGPATVPEGKLFVLGDNRDRSFDSRFWGFVDAADVIGQVSVIYWSRDPEAGVRWGRIGQRVE